MTNWIKSLADEAKKENWCIKTFCTTCGSQVFRSSLAIKGCQNGGVSLNPNDIKHSSFGTKKPFLLDLSPLDKKTCVETICKELATLSLNDVQEIEPDPLRLIFLEIYRNNYLKLAKEITSNTPAGNYLRSMEAHSKYVDKQRKIHEINQSPKVVAEKRRIKKELAAKAHVERIAKYIKFSFIKKYWFKFKKK